jgi:hypothetical protein
MCVKGYFPSQRLHCFDSDPSLQAIDADVAKLVDAADFNWSARREICGAEPLKLGERYRL